MSVPPDDLAWPEPTSVMRADVMQPDEQHYALDLLQEWLDYWARDDHPNEAPVEPTKALMQRFQTVASWRRS